ncbi:hypothetical protein PRK78_002663 [Emydomyces testavorans]|uniref:DUF7924 domain-containing protein n=1 Tax=Emydomyces testavorans TaxID=2070801 RepID=A0AAF0DGS3_9EURO|nr:hypothetical protein PRK78_002663 [Emydomyces testavorans]
MPGVHEFIMPRERRKYKEEPSEGVQEPRRHHRSSGTRNRQQFQKDTRSHRLRSGEKVSLIHLLWPHMRPSKVEEAMEKRSDAQPRKRTQRLSPAKQPKVQKRPREFLDQVPAEAPRKRIRRSTESSVVDPAVDQGAVNNIGEEEIDPISYWMRTNYWPEGYAGRSNNMSHLVAKRRLSPLLRRKQVELPSVVPSSTTLSDQTPREVKSAPYQNPQYETLLATKGSFMDKFELGLMETSKALCYTLLDEDQTVPGESLFRDDVFESTCQNIRNRNEARVIQDIARLIVPSAETLAAYGATHLQCLVESINEGWDSSIPLTGTPPQPDYSVGFRHEAFTKDQLDRLSPFIGNFIIGDQSFFMATYYMYFPFLTCEVKCGATALDVADRQNAHSMTLSVRAIVELFRLVGCEMELHREILAFSISHDHSSVRIYGHYPVIKGKDTTYYRHPIHKFDFTALNGKEKWTAYKFTKNVYDKWMPGHFKRICAAVDKIPPDIDFSVESGSRHPSESPGPGSPSRGFSHLSNDDAAGATPDTSYTGERATKRPRKR